MTERVDWTCVDTVIFDVDGTLYDQAPIRRRMMLELTADAVRNFSLRNVQVVRTYRHERERVADERIDPFEAELLRRVATSCSLSTSLVAEISTDWLQRRALPHLKRAVFPGVHQFFTLLRRRGKQIAVYSDYPAALKLQAMGLAVDIVVSAHDVDVSILKPHPRGLEKVLSTSGTPPQRCLLIGDRVDRDAAASGAVGVPCLIRHSNAVPGIRTFGSYLDDMFLDV